MPGIGMLKELFRYNDWARDRLFAAAAKLSDAELDRSFDMGMGSLRRTLVHLYDAEWVWLERWCGRSPGGFEEKAEHEDVRRLWDVYRELAQRRNELLAGAGAAGVSRIVHYARLDGTRHEGPLGILMLHVCNHGVHHRAQALHMLRMAGGEAPQPGLDYIYWKLDAAHPAGLEISALPLYFEYGDWANERMLAVAAGLPEAALDVRWPVGLGTIRATLLHIRFAEQWWLNNWTVGHEEAFPELAPDTPLERIVVHVRETAAARAAYLDRLEAGDLLRLVHAQPAPDVVKTFPLGVAALQLCTHGTHHRAQLANMLRRSGAEVPPLDLVAWWGQRADVPAS